MARPQHKSWQPRFHELRHPRRRPRVKQPRDYFRSANWPKFGKVHLVIVISKLATEERLGAGPERSRFRRKRLRAVEIFRKRFGTHTLVERDSAPRLPRL